MEIIKCEKLNFQYALANSPALNDVNFSVDEGELCIVLGKSGAGKSTLLKLLKSEISPAGRLDGKINIGANVGYVSQNVEENIVTNRVRSELSFGLENMGLSYDEIELLVNETASYFNLSDKLDCEISNLSGGEKQVLNLASVMIMKPEILVLDEPTSQLDPISSEKFMSTLLKLHSDFCITVIMSEHMSGDLFGRADSIVFMKNGTVVAKLPPVDMVSYLRENKEAMLNAVPLENRIFKNAQGIGKCREIIKNMHLQSACVEHTKDKVSLKADHICFAYEKNNNVIDDLSIRIYEGKINAIVGNNATGKTTLLKLLSGVLNNHHGRIKTDKKAALLCQNPLDMFSCRKCCEEVEFGDLTDFLEINDIVDMHPYDLSGGQAQRLALAKVLSVDADIIILDEPTKALDCVLKEKFALKLRELCDMGKTVVIAGHDIDFIGEYADYVSFMSQGKIITSGLRQEFFSSLNFYTTSVARMTQGIVSNVVSVSDLEKCGGGI